jgi:hypothetical protein
MPGRNTLAYFVPAINDDVKAESVVIRPSISLPEKELTTRKTETREQSYKTFFFVTYKSTK